MTFPSRGRVLAKPTMFTGQPRTRWVGVLLALTACGSTSCGSASRGSGAEARTPAVQSAPVQGRADDAAASASGAKVVLLPPGQDPVTVRVEVAREEEERRRGLMYRTQLDADAGMIFLFERPQHLTFWMRNTEIPLDMIFIEPSFRILGIVENAEPRTDTSRSVPGDSQYVLEVNAGFSRSHGLGPGTMVRFEGVTPAP